MGWFVSTTVKILMVTKQWRAPGMPASSCVCMCARVCVCACVGMCWQWEQTATIGGIACFTSSLYSGSRKRTNPITECIIFAPISVERKLLSGILPIISCILPASFMKVWTKWLLTSFSVTPGKVPPVAFPREPSVDFPNQNLHMFGYIPFIMHSHRRYADNILICACG